MVFDKVRSLFDITQIQRHFPGYEVSLESALTWIIRELRLHGVWKEIIDLSSNLMVGHLQVRTQSLVNTVYLISRFLYCILQQLCCT